MELEAFHCPRWEELPQLALYMDQVLLVLSTAFAPLSAGQPPVTASMINNYVKLKPTAPAVPGQPRGPKATKQNQKRGLA